MPKKTLPKPRAGLNARRVPRKEVEGKETVILVFGRHGIALDDEGEKKLEWALSSYFWDKFQHQETPTMADCNNALKALRRAAQKFQAALNGLDKRTWDLILKANAVTPAEDCRQNERLGWEAKKQNAQAAQKWELAAYATLLTVKGQKDKRGSDSALRGLLCSLTDIYELASGREAGLSKTPDTGAPGGPLFRLVADVLQALGIATTSDEGLYKAIRSALKIKKANKADPA